MIEPPVERSTFSGKTDCICSSMLPVLRTIRRETWMRFMRWSVVAVVAAGINVGVLHFFAAKLGWPYALATLASGEIAGLIRFLATDRWVFGHRRPTWLRLGQYHVADLLGFCIWWSATNLLEKLGVHYLLAPIAAIPFSLGFSLLSNFGWIWRKRAPQAASHSNERG
jgi:putative flippase GtrA